ncbi:hypothetical protein EK904_001868 [Melospiza melodia maxima]|nr:hypothetical protein EK904_001868 [Melospiza melodia maxima]
MLTACQPGCAPGQGCSTSHPELPLLQENTEMMQNLRAEDWARETSSEEDFRCEAWTDNIMFIRRNSQLSNGPTEHDVDGIVPSVNQKAQRYTLELMSVLFNSRTSSLHLKQKLEMKAMEKYNPSFQLNNLRKAVTVHRGLMAQQEEVGTVAMCDLWIKAVFLTSQELFRFRGRITESREVWSDVGQEPARFSRDNDVCAPTLASTPILPALNLSPPEWRGTHRPSARPGAAVALGQDLALWIQGHKQEREDGDQTWGRGLVQMAGWLWRCEGRRRHWGRRRHGIMSSSLNTDSAFGTYIKTHHIPLHSVLPLVLPSSFMKMRNCITGQEKFGNLRRFLLFALERPKQPVDEKDLSAASPQRAALGNCGWGSFSSLPAGHPCDDLRGSMGLTDLWSMQRGKEGKVSVFKKIQFNFFGVFMLLWLHCWKASTAFDDERLKRREIQKLRDSLQLQFDCIHMEEKKSCSPKPFPTQKCSLQLRLADHSSLQAKEDVFVKGLHPSLKEAKPELCVTHIFHKYLYGVSNHISIQAPALIRLFSAQYKLDHRSNAEWSSQKGAQERRQ